MEDPQELAKAIVAEIDSLTTPNTPNARAVRKKYSRALEQADISFILDLARYLILSSEHRWLAYELIESHPAAYRSLGEAELEELGRGINSWWTVDAFARTLSGPAWRDGLISDDLIWKWAHSDDLWWRRAALVSTVALNMRSKGGTGDVPRTLEICHTAVKDHEDMVVKALSWALRMLVVHDAEAVTNFLEHHEDVLAARVKCEVRHKLQTGLKSPRRKLN